MREPPRRKRFQIHLSTAVVMMIAAGGLIWANVRGRRVQAIAPKLNYKVDKNASNLRCQRSSTLALLFFEDPTPDDSQINPFFPLVNRSISSSYHLDRF